MRSVGETLSSKHPSSFFSGRRRLYYLVLRLSPPSTLAQVLRRDTLASLPLLDSPNQLTMPPSRLPPTPAMSAELVGKEKPSTDGVEFSFQLPPAALPSTSTTSQSHRSPSVGFLPASPTSPDLAMAASGHRTNQGDLDLPPPPTRTRRIIQMKPKTQETRKPASTANRPSKDSGKDSNAGNKASTNGGGPATNSKRKQGGTGGTAGKKVARKTAHSLIERRRRSKMNEEFGTLKDMIPACTGQEMHKLSILQVRQ